MGPSPGTILRLLGYLVELAAVVAIVQGRARGGSISPLLWAGIATGVALIVAGNLLNLRARRSKDRRGIPPDLP